MTGYYTFWIASDDSGELWLSTNDNPANKVKIAYVTTATGSRDWNNSNNPFQESAPIYLQAGQRYYVEALQKQAGGNDNLAVRWQLPDGSWENGDPTIPIPGIRLSPYGGVDFTPPTAPANLWAGFNGADQVTLTWSPAVDPDSGVDHYVIYRDGTAYATSTTTSFTDSSLGSQSWHAYQVSAVNYGSFEGARSQGDNVIATGVLSVVEPTDYRVCGWRPDIPICQLCRPFLRQTGMSAPPDTLSNCDRPPLPVEWHSDTMNAAFPDAPNRRRHPSARVLRRRPIITASQGVSSCPHFPMSPKSATKAPSRRTRWRSVAITRTKWSRGSR
jgi:hypothetical protein